MLAVDTNIVIRLLVNDDEEQHARALSVFRNHTVWISRTVLLECEWVLRSAYRFDRQEIASALSKLYLLENTVIDNAEGVTLALRALGEGADFADALHFYSAFTTGCEEGFATFDARFMKRMRKLAPILPIFVP